MIPFPNMMVFPSASQAQLDLLLRRAHPVEPRWNACGRYLFEADEPEGQRQVEFEVCIRDPGSKESVELEMWANDSLEVRIQVRSALFRGEGTLLDNIIRVVQIEGEELFSVEPEDWQKLPALKPAPELPVEEERDLGERIFELGDQQLAASGRSIREGKVSRRQLGDSMMTQSKRNSLEIWTCPAAPILGVVSAQVTKHDEIRIEPPIKGVNNRKPLISSYSLRLIEIGQAPD